MRNRDARVAGALYLVAILVGFVTLRYLPDMLIKSGDALGTAHNLAEHEFLLRLAVVGDFVAGVVWLFVILALYRLLKGVDRTQASLMVILGAFMQVPLYFVNAANYIAALLLVSDPTFLAALSSARGPRWRCCFSNCTITSCSVAFFLAACGSFHSEPSC